MNLNIVKYKVIYENVWEESSGQIGEFVLEKDI